MRRGMFGRTADAVARITGVLFSVSKAMAVLLLIIAFLDVVFRRLRLPLGGAMELTEAVFCILCFFSFAFAWIKGDHIRVGIFIERAPPRVQKLVTLASALIGIFVLGCLVYSGLQLIWFSLTRGDTTANLHLPRALPQSAMVVGALVFCLQIIASLPAELRRIDQASKEEESL